MVNGEEGPDGAVDLGRDFRKLSGVCRSGVYPRPAIDRLTGQLGKATDNPRLHCNKRHWEV